MWIRHQLRAERSKTSEGRHPREGGDPGYTRTRQVGSLSISKKIFAKLIDQKASLKFYAFIILGPRLRGDDALRTFCIVSLAMIAGEFFDYIQFLYPHV